MNSSSSTSSALSWQVPILLHLLLLLLLLHIQNLIFQAERLNKNSLFSFSLFSGYNYHFQLFTHKSLQPPFKNSKKQTHTRDDDHHRFQPAPFHLMLLLLLLGTVLGTHFNLYYKRHLFQLFFCRFLLFPFARRLGTHSVNSRT